MMKHLILVILMTATVPASAKKWKALPLKERLCDAELIVIGKLSDVRERYMSVGFETGKRPYKTYYDLAYIREPKFLKPTGYKKEPLSVIFQSKEQPPENPFGTTRKSHQAGDEGIWRLKRDFYSGSYILLEPESPLPLSKEEEIVKILSEKDSCQ